MWMWMYRLRRRHWMYHLSLGQVLGIAYNRRREDAPRAQMRRHSAPSLGKERLSHALRCGVLRSLASLLPAQNTQSKTPRLAVPHSL